MRSLLHHTLALLSLSVPATAAEPPGLLGNFDRGTVVLEAGHDCVRIEAWFADTPDTQRQGLMFVRRLGEYEGMLFRYSGTTVLTMWMKNTYIPLDMVFIDGQRRITRIETDTEPLSERVISSGQPVTAVLELNAGAARKWGLQPGHRLLLVDSWTPSG